MILAAGVPVLLLAVVAWVAVERLQTDAIVRENSLAARTVSIELKGRLAASEALVSPYLSSGYNDLRRADLFRSLWVKRVNTLPPLKSMLLLDDRGSVAVAAVNDSAAVPADVLVGLDRSKAPEYILAKKAGRPVWSDVYTSPITGLPAVAYVAPLSSGTIILELGVDGLGLSVARTEGGTPMLLDRAGVLLFHPDRALLRQRPNLSNVAVVKDARSTLLDQTGRLELNGVEYFAHVEPMPSTGWAVVSLRLVSDVKDAVRGARLGALLIVALGLALALAIALASADRLMRPVADLVSRARAVGAGSYQPSPEHYRYEELEELSTAFNDMATSVSRREEEVAESARRFRLLVESLRAVPWEYDPVADAFNYVGPQLTNLFGYAPDSWADFASWAAMVHPEDRARAIQARADAAEHRQDYDLLYRMVASDGRTLHVHDIVSVQTRADSGLRLVGVLLDITERAEVEELRLAAQTAEAASQAKSSFLACMSHEFRTPLNSILGFSQVLLSGLSGEVNEEQHRQLGMIRRSGGHLMLLVNDILDLERIESGAVEISSAPLDMSALIATAIDEVAPLAAVKGLGVEKDVPNSEVCIESDEDRVRQILLNLLSNAIKFTDEGRIKIVVTPAREGFVTISVCDTGVGIPPNLLEDVFEEFKTMGRANGTSQEGTGLGLAISRRLARMLGGDLVAASEVGSGSTFTLTLPG